MVTYIEVIEGANIGSRYKIQEGMNVGRSQGDIIIPDPKISGTHARIEKNDRDQFVLFDLNSANGLYIEDRRVKKVTLLQGVRFEIGRTQFRVVMAEEDVLEAPTPQLSWRNILKRDLDELAKAPLEGSTKITPFSTAIKLSFTQGVQADQEIILGYGPRIAGSDSLDIEFKDDSTPKIAFEVRAGDRGVELKSLALGRVALNHKTITTVQVLQDGDLISVGNTWIKISYLNN